MTDDPVGIRQDRVVTGHRCQDVGFDPDIGGYVQKDAPQDRSDGDDQRPAERVATEGKESDHRGRPSGT